MAQYIPEYDYSKTNYTPLHKNFTNDLCGHCRSYYKRLYERGLTTSPFPPQCQGHVLDTVRLLERKDFDTDEEYEATQILFDPVAWAKQEFDWDPRWYQENVLSCSAKMKILRGGRRSGKSRVELVLVLYEMMTQSRKKILLLCPNERLIGEFFDVITQDFIGKSTNLKNSIARYTRNPHLIQLKNGSQLLGISISPNDPMAGDKARGFDANMFVIDEAEMFKDSDMESIMALMASNRETKVMISSTPKGWRKHFYRTCTNKDLGFKEFWWISAESPEWTPETEKTYRIQYSKAGYTQEFEADFGELEEGVFKKKFLEASIEDYNMDNIQPQPGRKYILGVDWNKSAGNHMIILDNDNNKLKVVKKIVIPESEYMQTKSVQHICELHMKWKFKHIFLDKGFGVTQYEMLQKWGMQNPASGMIAALNAYSMNQSVEILDPTTGQPVKLQAKAFLVSQTAKLLEDGNLILPKSEDYGAVSGDSAGLKDVGLVEQMRNYKVEAYSIYNQPRYSQGADHTLTAFMLACGGFILKEGGLTRVEYSSKIVGVSTPTENAIELSATAKERLNDMKKYRMVSPGKFGQTMRKSLNTRDFGSLIGRKSGFQSREFNLDRKRSI